MIQYLLKKAQELINLDMLEAGFVCEQYDLAYPIGIIAHSSASILVPVPCLGLVPVD